MFYFQQGNVTTKIDSLEEYSDDYFPVGYDFLVINQGAYFQAGIDMGGRFIYDLLTLLWEDKIGLHELDYGMDESFLNLKGGAFFHGQETFGFGYGLDLDMRVNKYREVNGASANAKKVRIGLGPNAGFRLSPFSWVTFFPNVSGYYYPWPNEDQAFIPKSFDSFGYRAEFPLILDLVDAFTKESTKSFVISAMPFVGSKSGFYRKDDQTQKVQNAEASVYGIKLGAVWKLDIFTFMWKE